MYHLTTFWNGIKILKFIVSSFIWLAFFKIMFLGRVHSSMLSGINLDSKSATVEWYENGETKGKEVTLIQKNA